MTVKLPEASFLYVDLFPAELIQAPHRGDLPSHQEYRIIVSDSNIILLQDGNPADVILVDDLEAIEKHKGTYTATSPQGDYVFSRAQNCGCGNRVRGFRKYEMLPYNPVK